MTYMNTRARWTTTLAAAASIALAASAFAQTAAPTQSAPAGDQALTKQHLTGARNALSEVTQLPAAAQLRGAVRTQVQELISNFNELIASGSEWRGPYAKVASNLDALLGPAAATTGAAGTAGVSGTPGAVGTSGTATAIDPAIRVRLMEFRAYLSQFEAVASAAASPTPAPQAPPASPPSMIVPGAKPDVPHAMGPPSNDTQVVTVVAKDLLLHIEALEVILGAQTAAQKAATAAAGGAMVSHETISGSTRTTVSGPDVTLNADQLGQINTHLKELRRLLERK
jgi:hypothetical protein